MRGISTHGYLFLKFHPWPMPKHADKDVLPVHFNRAADRLGGFLSNPLKAQSKMLWGMDHTGVFVVISLFSADSFISLGLGLAVEWNGLGTVEDAYKAST